MEDRSRLTWVGLTVTIADISGVKTEDIISIPLGGHETYLLDPAGVAWFNIRTPPGQHCADQRTNVAEHGETADVTVRACGLAYTVRVAKLHSGEWIQLDKQKIK